MNDNIKETDLKHPQPIDYGVKDNAHYIEGFLFVLGAAFGLILAFDAVVGQFDFIA